MSVQQTTDVLIIGAGVSGCSIAYFLSKAGVQVSVVERKEVAAEASSAAAGLLAPLGEFAGPGAFTDLLMASWTSFPEVIPAIEEASGVSVEYYSPGSLHTGTSEDEIAQLRARLTTWEAAGLQVRWLTGNEIRDVEPLLHAGIEYAIYSPQAASIKPALMTRAFAGAARKQGARFYEGTEVVGIGRSGSKVEGVETANGEFIACQRLIIATGAWSEPIGKWLGFSLPVSPMRGQILALRQPAPALQHIIFGEGIYLVPKRDHTIYVGATVEQAGFDTSLTAEGIAWLLTSAIRLVPALGKAAIVKMWAGLRPWSPDRHPILGPAPGWENVFLATGHGPTGFELSAITGKSIAELVISGQVPEIIRPFGLERFQENP